MLKNENFILCVMLLFIISCSGELKKMDFDAGSNVEKNGRINQSGLNFDFSDYKKGGAIKDFCNHAYFNGDTLCFSFKMNKKLNEENSKVYFIINGKRHEAERVEYVNNRVYGFSLVGSLLEKYYLKELYNQYSEIKFPVEIPCQIQLAYIEKDKEIKIEENISFIIDVK